MHKIKINGYFKNCDMNATVNYDCYGEKKENKIEFKNDFDIITITFINDQINFKRENSEIIMCYKFDTTKNTTKNSYLLKNENLKMEFEIETIQIINKENTLYIEFRILDVSDNSNYELNINYKVV